MSWTWPAVGRWAMIKTPNQRKEIAPLSRISVRIALLVVAAFGLVAILNNPIQAQGGGKDLFLKNQCNKCHTINAQGIKRIGTADDDSDTKPPDLSKVGKDRSAAWIVGWLNKTEMIKGKKHKKKFAGTPADAQAIATWLAGLK